MNFETGVISVSSFSIGAWAVAAPTALIARTSARTTPQNRRMWLLLIYVPAICTRPDHPTARSGRSAPIRSFGRLATGGIPSSLAFRRGAPAPTALRLAPRPARVARLPLQRSFDRAAPAVVSTRARGGILPRSAGPLAARAVGQRIQRAPEAGSHASQIRRTQPRRLRHRGPDHGDIEDIRLKLAEEVVGGGTAIDAQPSRDDPGVGGHGLEDVTALVRDRLQRRASEMGGGRAPRQAHDGTPRPHVPVGRAQAHERRHEIDAAGVGNGLRDALAVGGGAQDAEAVAQPLDGGAGDEDAALEGVGDPSVETPRDRREQPVARRDGSVAGVEQQETAGAVRVLGVT